MRSPADAGPAFVWAPELAAPGTLLELDDATTHHVLRVWRARAGDRLVLTDGRGGRAVGRVVETARQARVEIDELELVDPPAPLHLLCGAPEGERGDWLVEKLAELGVTRLRPIETRRAAWEGFDRRRPRWERLAVAAMCQSHGCHRIEIATPLPLESAIEDVGPAWTGLVADPGGVSWEAPGGESTGIAAVIGPSSGLEWTEVRMMLDRGFVAITLGSKRLRAETAAVVLAALVRCGPGQGSRGYSGPTS